MSVLHADKVIIQGVTLEGNTFRPSDWLERLCSSASSFDYQQRLCYSQYLYPIMIDNKRYLLLDKELSQHYPEMYQHVIDFIELNRLLVSEYLPSN